MKLSFLKRVPWETVPAVALAIYTALLSRSLTPTPGPPMPRPPTGMLPFSDSEALLLAAAQIAILLLFAWLPRWMTKNEAGRLGAGIRALFVPAAVLWQEGRLVAMSVDPAGMPFGPWAGLVTGATAGALLVWAHLIVRARSLRHGSVLFLWPIIAASALEFGINATALRHAPLFTNVMEDNTWVLYEHTNLFENHNTATTVTLPHGERAPITAPPGVRRLLALGSSSTYGAGLSAPSQAWPARLGKRLPEGWQALNAGFGGYNSFQLDIYLEDVLLMLKPEIVVFYYGGNEGYGHSAKELYRRARKLTAGADCSGYPPYDRQTCLEKVIRYGTDNRAAIFLLDRLMRNNLFLGMRNLILRTEKNYKWQREERSASYRMRHEKEPPTSLDVLLSMSRACTGAGARFVVLPELSYPGNLPQAYYETMKEAARRDPNIIIIDPTVIVEWGGTNPLFLDSSHLTPLGCDLLSRRIAEGLAQARLVEGKFRTPGDGA